MDRQVKHYCPSPEISSLWIAGSRVFVGKQQMFLVSVKQGAAKQFSLFPEVQE
jgi:hypothetical protein